MLIVLITHFGRNFTHGQDGELYYYWTPVLADSSENPYDQAVTQVPSLTDRHTGLYPCGDNDGMICRRHES